MDYLYELINEDEEVKEELKKQVISIIKTSTFRKRLEESILDDVVDEVWDDVKRKIVMFVKKNVEVQFIKKGE